MTEKEALELIKKHKGRIEADYKAPDWSHEANKECIFIVTLWRLSDFGVGAEGGGNTLIEATKMALESLKEIEESKKAEN